MSLKMLSGSMIQLSNRVVMIPTTQNLKRSARSAHLADKPNVEREKEEQGEEVKAREEKEISDRLQKEKN